MDWLTWKKGRQNSGYERMLIIKSLFPLPFDCYLIRYQTGDSIPFHTDPVKNGWRHFRINLFLKQAREGGEFLTKGPVIYSRTWIQFFRPDITPHAVSEIRDGKRLILSIGWLLPGK